MLVQDRHTEGCPVPPRDQGVGWLDNERLGDPVGYRREIGASPAHEGGGKEPGSAEEENRGGHGRQVGRVLPLVQGGCNSFFNPDMADFLEMDYLVMSNRPPGEPAPRP